jgi:hypothetical protein
VPSNVSPIIEQSRNLQDMLCDAFRIHEVNEDNCKPETIVEGVQKMCIESLIK